MKVLFLDWYKTLSNTLFWEHLKTEDREKYERITTSCFVTHSDLTKPWMRGIYSSEDIAKFVSKDTGIDKNYILKELEKSATEMKFVSGDIPGMVQGIRNKGIFVVIATDNMDTLTKWTIKAMNLDDLFDGILNSWDLKALKGDFHGKKSLFFDHFFQKYSMIRPNECTIIDDADDKEKRISNYGIEYRKIFSGEELKKELISII